MSTLLWAFKHLPTVILVLSLFCRHAAGLESRTNSATKDASVLILGGGVTGVIAARTLHERGHDNFIVVDARGELGGRMQTEAFGTPGNTHTVEQGPNWVQGTQTGNGPVNPIFTLAQKHNVTVQFNDLFGSLCKFTSIFP